MICAIVRNLSRLVLDSLFGREEPFEYLSKTTPYEERRTLEDA